MAELLELWWGGLDGGSGLTRRDRAGCHYHAFLPDPLTGRTFQFEGRVAADVADAERRLSSLDRAALTLGNTETLARLLLRAESVASSRIEGLEVAPRRLLRADVAREEGASIADVTALEVLGNVDAMAFAVASVEEGSPITKELILETHRRLLGETSQAQHAGRIRTVQNWIGGSSYNPCSASFVPPPPDRVEGYLDDLCAFCNDDALPAVAQAAIAHAQFETIHPFVDGNGRVGRALIQMILRRRGLVRRTLPPVSLVLATYSVDYIAALRQTHVAVAPTSREAMDGINAWVALFAAACTRAVDDAATFEKAIETIKKGWPKRLGSVRSHSAARALLDVLTGVPIVTVKSAVKLTGRSTPAVNDAIARLVDARILHQPNARAWNRTFEAREIIDAFVGLERKLASPAGDTVASPPARRVPAR
jgi:Fic family protein